MDLAFDQDEFDEDKDGPGKTVPAIGETGRRVDASGGEHAIEICDCMIDILSAMFNVSGREMRKPGRSRVPVARVRQIGMYICHCLFGLTMTDVGKGFGRDRTTVMHACHMVEDLRDDEDFDRVVTTVEKVAAAALRFNSS